MLPYLANFDFDDRLAGRTGGSRLPPPVMTAAAPVHLFRLLHEASFVLRIIVPGLTGHRHLPADGPLCETKLEPADITRTCPLVPWGWDSLAKRLAGQHAPPSPVLAAVRLVNGRRFAAMLSGTDWTRDPNAVLRRAAAGELLMLKTEHGGFGRGLRRILGPEQDANLVGWVTRQCRRGGLVVEPLVPPTTEVATHFEVSDDGLVLLGQTQLLANEHGQFVASVAGDGTVAIPEDVGAQITKAAEAVRRAGYRGPLSIDSAKLLDESWRAVQDINARWTVGRIALLASRRLETRVEIRNDAGRWGVITPEGETVFTPR